MMLESPFGLNLLGRVDLELRFLDIITLRQMVVEVVPQLYVRPGGQAIGILLSTQGIDCEPYSSRSRC